MRDLIRLVESALRESAVPTNISENEFDEAAYAIYVSFANEEEDHNDEEQAHIICWKTRKNQAIIQGMRSNARVRGRDMLKWFRSITSGMEVIIVEATHDAYGFWDQMMNEGLVDDVEIADGEVTPYAKRSVPWPDLLNMRLGESLTEGVGKNYLFHGTSFSNALMCVKENVLNAAFDGISLTRAIVTAIEFANTRTKVIGEDYYFGEEDDRDLFIAKYPAQWLENWTLGHFHSGLGAILVFDRDVLRQRNALKPYDDGHGGGGGRANHAKKWEFEERLRKNITPLRPQLAGIIIPALSRYRNEYAQLLVRGCESYRFPPHPEFNPALEWIFAHAKSTFDEFKNA